MTLKHALKIIFFSKICTETQHVKQLIRIRLIWEPGDKFLNLLLLWGKLLKKIILDLRLILSHNFKDSVLNCDFPHHPWTSGEVKHHHGRAWHAYLNTSVQVTIRLKGAGDKIHPSVR